VFWLPQEDTSIVVLVPAPSSLAASEFPPIVDQIVQRGDEGLHSLHDLGDNSRIQLLRLGEPSDTAMLAVVVSLDVGGFGRLEAVHRLLSSLHGRVVPSDTRLTGQQRARARRMLQAFDGYRDGATQREIARVIFHLGPLDRDAWQESSTRHAVKALLRDARAMIAGGYRKLLRHRWRS